MSEDSKNEINYIESKGTKLLGPVLFLVFVLLISAGLFAYNKYIQNEVEKLQKDLAAERQIIGELEARKDIQVYSLLKNNERVISELEKRSKVSTYIKHLKSLSPENVYGITFEGFSLAAGKITTRAIVEGVVGGKTAYQKTRDFIKDYRNSMEASGTGVSLELEFVNLIEGMDSMRFDANFKIK